MVDRLESIRKLTRQIAAKQAEYSAMQPAPKPVKLDGLPHGSGDGGEMDALIDAREEMRKRIVKLRGQLGKLEGEVKPFVDGLPEHLHTFAINYYIEGKSLKAVAAIMDRDERTARRYKQDVEYRAKMSA